MTEPATIAPSAVPKHIINAITQYGDSRADDGLASGPALGKVIAAINEHYEQAGGLPSLPEPEHYYFDVGESLPTSGFTADQMQDYARAALAARQAGVDRVIHDFPALQAFHIKHALGPMLAPSCLCCGQQTHPVTRPVAIKHGELPGIVICETCRELAARQAPDSRDAAAVLPPPIGYARKQDLLTYSPAWMAYSAKPAAENGHEAVALFSEDQVRAAITQEKAQ
jgi:hypothetical protein